MSSQTATATMTRMSLGSFYRITILNDDYTEMESVIKIVQDVFDHDENTAFDIALEIHENGHSVVVDNLTEDDAIDLLDACMGYARKLGCDKFKAIMEKQS